MILLRLAGALVALGAVVYFALRLKRQRLPKSSFLTVFLFTSSLLVVSAD